MTTVKPRMWNIGYPSGVTLVFKEFWEMVEGKMSGKRNVCAGTAEKGGKVEILSRWIKSNVWSWNFIKMDKIECLKLNP